MRMPGHRIVRATAVMMLTGVCVAAPLSLASVGLAQTSTSPEYLIKAAYLLNFARLIDWPRNAFATVKSPMTICVLGSDPFGQALELTVEGKRISNRPIAVRRPQWDQTLRQCQVLFISSADSNRIGELASRVTGLPILIVGEATDLAKRGATINFTIENDRVRFEVNLEAAKRARLTISSQVLRLARIVRDS